MNQSANTYFTAGCGRCDLGGTPSCKVHPWAQELALLRKLLLASPLEETCKWGVPCYTYQQKNIVLLSALKAHCSISFFKGALLQDPHGLLSIPGPNSQAARVLVFKDVASIEKTRKEIADFITQAITIDTSGQQLPQEKKPEPIPVELQQRFQTDAAFKQAF